MTDRAHLVNRSASIGRVGSLLDIAAHALREAYRLAESDILTDDDITDIAQAFDSVICLAHRIDEAMRKTSGSP